MSFIPLILLRLLVVCWGSKIIRPWALPCMCYLIMIQKSLQHMRLQDICSWKSHHHHDHHHPYFQGLVSFWCFLSSQGIDLCLRHPMFCWPVDLYCRHMYVSWLSFIFKIYSCQFCLLCSVLIWRWYVFNYCVCDQLIVAG